MDAAGYIALGIPPKIAERWAQLSREADDRAAGGVRSDDRSRSWRLLSNRRSRAWVPVEGKIVELDSYRLRKLVRCLRHARKRKLFAPTRLTN